MLMMIMNLTPWHNTNDFLDIIDLVKIEEFIGLLNENYINKCNQNSGNIINQIGNTL